jgi:dihydrofolate synthase / folylpolyglutamate synthase
VSEPEGGLPEGADEQNDYASMLQWLYSLQVYGVKLGLEKITRLCAEMGVQTQSDEKRKYIHVAGTNGKGSVCAMLAAICCACGKRTGLYTSPHLVSFRERMRLGPYQIPEQHAADLLAEARRFSDRWEQPPTFFEVATAVALAWFQRQRAEWIILETGMGGRLDATNVVTPVVSVITPIGFDHMQHLGDTLAAIAGEKAGIIKPGVPVISSPQEPEAEAVIRAAAEAAGARVKVLHTPISDTWRMSLPGSHQRMNAAVAFAALIEAGLRPDPRAVGQALSRVEWPGRFQMARNGTVVFDGAHNPSAAERLVATWREQFGDEKATLVFGVLADKDAPGLCKALLQIARWVICVPVRSPRAMDPKKLAELVRELSDVPCTTVESVGAGLLQAQRHPERTLVTGSLFLVGEGLAHLGLVPGTHEWSAQ